MSTGLFVCEDCGTVDNVDLAYSKSERKVHQGRWICTSCQGKPWHDQFPMAPYDSTNDHVLNRPDGIGLG